MESSKKLAALAKGEFPPDALVARVNAPQFDSLHGKVVVPVGSDGGRFMECLPLDPVDDQVFNNDGSFPFLIEELEPLNAHTAEFLAEYPL